MIKPKIVATIWPASENPDVLREILPYVAIARMNFSHGSYEEHKNKIDLVKKINPNTKILIDLQWPKIRVGKFPEGPVHYNKWERTHIVYDKWMLDMCDKEHLYVSIPELVKDVSEWDILLFNDWYLGAKVIEKRDWNRLYIEMLNYWTLSNNKWVNSSTASLSVDPITEKDILDLEFGVTQNPDYIALSFVRSADDVRRLREMLNKHNSTAKIIVKIERHEAIANLEEIVEETDLVMIARWDLWVEVDIKELPKLQLQIIEVSKKYNKPCIWATQVLESMIKCPMPTRAEVTDVHTAITAGADYTMLSWESATWSYVIETVQFMHDMWEKYWK